MKQKVLARVLLLIAFAFCMQSYAKGEKAKRFAFLFESESGWVQEDSIVKVTYNIKEGDATDGEVDDFRYPHVIVTVKNKTMKPIYVDLGQCFLVKGEEPYAYYVPGETHTTTGTSTGVSVNMGSVTGALGLGGVMGTLANGVNVGGGSSSVTTNITYTQRVVAVPPMSAKVLPKKPLVSYFRNQMSLIEVKDFGGTIWVGNAGTINNPRLYLYSSNMQPMNQGEYIEYTAANSPVFLHSFVAYSLTEDCSQTVTLSHNCFVRYVIATKYGKGYKNRMKYKEELSQYVSDTKRYREILICRGKNSGYWY